VQKTLQTDAIVREERLISDKNDQLEEQIAQRGSPVRVRHIAETQLGLVDATHIAYPEALLPKSDAEVAATR